MHVAIAVPPTPLASGVAALSDIFGVADRLRARSHSDIAPITTSLHGPRRTPVSPTGLSVHCALDYRDLQDADRIIVAAPSSIDAENLSAELNDPACRGLIRVIADLGSDVKIGAACTGTFVLGEAGRLEGGRATTSWWLANTFRHWYQGTELDMAAMVVEDGPITTAGAAFAHIDLALHILAGISPDLAHEAAEFLVVDRRPAQSSYIAVAHLDHHDTLVTAFERYVRAHLEDRLTIAELAVQIGTTRRTLERRVREATGMSPLGLVQRIRIEQARHLRATTDLNSDRIASLVGYANASTLRQLLRRQH